MIEKLKTEEESLANKKNVLIKTAYRKACKKDEELEHVEYMAFNMLKELNEDVKFIKDRVDMVQGKIDRLQDC